MSALVAGCGQEQVRISNVPKEQAAQTAQTAQPSMGNPHGAPGHGTEAAPPPIRYQTPEGWTVQPAGNMRAARFSIPGEGGQETDVSVIPLAGMMAGKQEIVNLWRQQIKLPPAKPEELTGLAEKVTVGSTNQGELYDMVSTEPLIEQKAKARILVAMAKQGPTTWFFKMTGEDKSVAAQKPAFVKFLKTVEFEAVPDMAAAHAMAGVNVPAAGANPHGASAPEGPAKPQWQVPAGWKEVPPSQMLVAKYALASSAGGKAEVTVSVFPGDVGGLAANINRWRGQIGLSSITAAEAEKMITSLDASAGKATLVDLSGQDSKSGRKTRLMGIIIPQAGRTWFYKLLGDDSVVEQEKAAFLKFAQTAKHPNAS